MASDLTPDEIQEARFRTGLRGFDSSEVTAFLDRIADEMRALIDQRDRMAARVGEHAERDLESEFESIGREVSAVLQSAREASEAMRERASLDATRWRSESMAEAEQARKEAKSDSEALRGDAWTTGTELLTQTTNEIKRLRQEAERDVLTVMGESEREAHRLTSSARREAEDLVRSAAMEAEKSTAEATKRRDELIEQAHRQAFAAEERTRALEERRAVLLEELETVRSMLTRLEGNLEERRDDRSLSVEESTSVKVVQPRSRSDPGTWAPGETVRVIPKDEEPAATSEAETLMIEDIGEVAPTTLPELEPAPLSEPAPPRAPAVEAPSTPDEVGALFASLRGGAASVSVAKPAGKVVEKTEPPAAPEPFEPLATLVVRVDWIEERDGRLLPITNRALRGVKKAVTEAQNVALDSLRTDGDWLPDAAALADGMRADLIGLWTESFSAGHDVAEEMVEAKLKRPDTPSTDAADSFGALLAESVSDALINAGDGQRERQSATSRVFRAWRSDEADRRIRGLAIAGYHGGIVGSTGPKHEMEWVTSGMPCTACKEAANDPRSTLPPVHAGCACSIVVT